MLVIFLFIPFTSTVAASQALAGNEPAGQSGSGSGNAGSSGSLPNYLPRSNPPGTVYVVGGGALNFEVATLEGLAARTQPQLFLSHSASDKFWLNYSEQLYGIKTQTLTQASALQMFKNLVTGSNGKIKVVLYSAKDPIQPAQLNVARTLAGVYNALPVSSSELSAVQSVYGASNLDVIYNLEGMFTNKVSAYDWLWNLVGSSVTKRLVSLSPDGDLGLTDYIVENKAFVFEFSLTNAIKSSESAEATKILSNYNQGTPVLGFFGLGPEDDTIAFLSKMGLYMIPCDQIGGLSFYSGLPEALNLKQLAPPSNVSYDSGKIYLAIQYSQGNSLGYLFNGNRVYWTQTDSQGKALRSEIPETWQINPVAAEIAPPVMEYWYTTMYPNDYFISSSSGGAGYVHPDQLPNLHSYLSLADQFNVNANLNEFVIVPGVTNKLQPTLYQQIVQDTSISAIFTKLPHNLQPTEVSGIPVFTMTYKTIKSQSWSTTDLNAAVKSIQSLASSNKFIWIFLGALNPGQSFLQALLKDLGSKFVALRSDQFTSVYNQFVALGGK